jgi:hypothetical protein
MSIEKLRYSLGAEPPTLKFLVTPLPPTQSSCSSQILFRVPSPPNSWLRHYKRLSLFKLFIKHLYQYQPYKIQRVACLIFLVIYSTYHYRTIDRMIRIVKLRSFYILLFSILEYSLVRITCFFLFLLLSFLDVHNKIRTLCSNNLENGTSENSRSKSG